MFNLLKVIRYLVFVVFAISNAIVASVAVWNLSIVDGSVRFSSTATVAAGYLIVVATMGLLLVFPVIFVEISGKKTFLGMVWFELAWVAIFGLMTLIGASLITSLSSRELCVPPSIVQSPFVTSALLVSPCSSAQVLSVFTWMSAFFLLAYMSLLAILAFVQSKEDPAIWKCLVRNLPVDKILGEVKRNSMVILPQIRRTPIIHAPRPRYIIPPLLDCRSARNSAYESQLPDRPAKSAPVREMTMSYQSSVTQAPYTSTAFYNPSVQKAMGSGGGSRLPQPPPAVQLGKSRQTSPPPLGDWPRLDATSRPRKKRYPRTAPEGQRPPTLEPSVASQQSSRRAPQTSVDRARTSPTRTRPPGSGRSGSGDSGSGSPSSSRRPPPLDLSKISAHRTRSERRAGR